MVVLEYRTRASTSKELSSEIGWVAGLFADAIDAGWRATGLDATILDPNGWPLAAFRVEREWAVAYSDGDITTEEFSARVASTRELLD